MLYSHVFLESLGYELAPNVVSSADLEQRLAPLYRQLKIPSGQIEALTGVRERRWWDARQSMCDGSIQAGRKALDAAGLPAEEIGMLIYAGVCRDQLEPATACAVADGLRLSGQAEIYDVSNACLGVINGMIQVANAIELGRIRAGMVVSCESARQIVEMTIERMISRGDMNTFRRCLATMTGGSGAVAVVLTDESITHGGHRLLGGMVRNAARFHPLCRWGPDTGIPATAPMVMDTDAPAVLENGVALGQQTWRDFLAELGWTNDHVDRVICHQVGTGHRLAILNAIGLPPDRDFSTVEFLGNIGTVSLPITAAIAEQRGFLQSGQRVAFLGIGSGLNCLMLGLEW
ncbi:MAG: 3-oxoacyl-ACP synthase III [Phycisphaerales bacterium]|nr:3-oxoacyl-ACP synthase III [Phycisphaerales bacterium]